MSRVWSGRGPPAAAWVTSTPPGQAEINQVQRRTREQHVRQAFGDAVRVMVTVSAERATRPPHGAAKRSGFAGNYFHGSRPLNRRPSLRPARSRNLRHEPLCVPPRVCHQPRPVNHYEQRPQLSPCAGTCAASLLPWGRPSPARPRAGLRSVSSSPNPAGQAIPPVERRCQMPDGAITCHYRRDPDDR